MIVREFYGQFYAGRVHPTEANHLVEIRQQDGESLKDYIQRFMRATAGAKTVGDEGKMMAITAGVKRRSPLWKSLRKDGVRTTQEFLDRADRYIKLEDSIADDGKPSGKEIRRLPSPPKPPMGLNRTATAKATGTVTAMARMVENGHTMSLPPPTINEPRVIVMNLGSLTTLPSSSLGERFTRPQALVCLTRNLGPFEKTFRKETPPSSVVTITTTDMTLMNATS